MPFGRFSISGDRNLPNQLCFIMAIKLAVLQDQEQLICDIKELIDDKKPVGYLLKSPHKIVVDEEKLNEDESVQITLTPWILLTSDQEIVIPNNHVVTIVEPIDSIKEMYMEKINGSESTSTDK